MALAAGVTAKVAQRRSVNISYGENPKCGYSEKYQRMAKIMTAYQ
jgi:hypothetical protein